MLKWFLFFEQFLMQLILQPSQLKERILQINNEKKTWRERWKCYQVEIKLFFRRHDTQHKDIPLKDTQHYDVQHKNKWNVTLSIIRHSIECHYAECRISFIFYAEHRNAECLCAECHYVECLGAIFNKRLIYIWVGLSHCQRNSMNSTCLAWVAVVDLYPRSQGK